MERKGSRPSTARPYVARYREGSGVRPGRPGRTAVSTLPEWKNRTGRGTWPAPVGTGRLVLGEHYLGDPVGAVVGVAGVGLPATATLRLTPPVPAARPHPS